MCSVRVLVGWCSVSCLVSQSVSWSVSTYSDITGWNRAASRAFSGRLGTSRPAARRLPRGHEELNVTGRRVQTGLDDQSGANKTFRHGRCQRAAGARAPPCHNTPSLSARAATRRAGLELLKVTEITASLIASLLLLLPLQLQLLPSPNTWHVLSFLH